MFVSPALQDSVTLLIDLSSSNGCCVTAHRCIVVFSGEQSGRKVEVDGFRRNHDYGVKTSTPGDVDGNHIQYVKHSGLSDNNSIVVM